MNRILFASLHSGVGKTSIALGLARMKTGKAGYLKPYGDRPFYRKKRLWDSDEAIMSRELSLGDEPGSITVGFDPARIRHTYDSESLSEKLSGMAAQMEENREALLIEGGFDLSAGASVGLDALSVAETLGARLFVVLAGEQSVVVDEAVFLARVMKDFRGDFGGIIVNKVGDLDDFAITSASVFESLQLPLAGVLPLEKELTLHSMSSIAEQTMAHTVCGQATADQIVEQVLVGLMSVTAARNTPAFQSSKKLLVTNAAHADLILAAIETGAAGILLSEGSVPHKSVISQAEQKGVPVLMVHDDLLSLSRRLDRLQPRLVAGDRRLHILDTLINERLDFRGLATPSD